MPEKLNILFVTSEAAPLVKTGGLADVAHALPKALREIGHDVRIALPCYDSISPVDRGEPHGTCFVAMPGGSAYGAWRESHLPGLDIPVYFVEHDGYYHRGHPYGSPWGEYWDNMERFSFFCLAVLDIIPQTGWRPDVVHCNDWHTALLPTYLKTRFHAHPFWQEMPSVFTIHNLRYQGRYGGDQYPKLGLEPHLFSPEFLEYYGDVNLMKGAIAFASKVNTVSRTYAREIQTPPFGHGLDGMLRTRKTDLSGIVNGIDYNVWNPAEDPHIEAHYNVENLAGKAACKAAIREKLDLADTPGPLFAMVSRMVWDKGVELLLGSVRDVLDRGAQLMVLGTGERHFELAFEQLAAHYPDQVSITLTYNEALSHQFYAGADFFIMPSHTEPCGLSQMYSLAYGAVPVVRKTGGLADTVTDVSAITLAKGEATGIVFRPATAPALGRAMIRAMHLYREPEILHRVQCAGMLRDLSWKRASSEYEALYREAMKQP